MKKNYQSSLILAFLLIIFTLYITNSELIVTNILEYTELFLTKLFPTSFIIYILTSLLINYKLIEKLSKLSKKKTTIYLTVMSMLSGFPSGPKYIKDLLEKDYITQENANYYLTYTHFPNPIFILGPVSTLITKKNSLKILFSIIISNLLIAFFQKNKEKETSPTASQESFINALTSAINSTIKIQIIVYGISLFFYLLSSIITNKLSLSPLLYVLITNIFDLTKGIFQTSILESITLRALIILIFTNFGSLSIHMQIKSILMDTNLNYKKFLYGRILSTILSVIIFIILIKL